MYGNMNPGLIVCRCLDGDSLEPVEGATVMLTWIATDPSAGQFKFYDLDGNETAAPSAETDSAGIALVKFLWDPVKIGSLVSSSPSVRVSAVGPAAHYDGWFSSERTNKLYFTTRVGNERLYECINLGQAWSGGKGAFTFKSTESHAIDALSRLKQLVEYIAKKRGGKLPTLPFSKIMRPEIEMDSLLGGFDIKMAQQTE